MTPKDPIETSTSPDVFDPEAVPRGEELGSDAEGLIIEDHPPSGRSEFPIGYQSVRLPDGAQIALPPGTLRLDDPLQIIEETVTRGTSGLCKGTWIKTPGGEQLVERLAPGDLVETHDRGPRRLRWIGTQRFRAKGVLAPVRVAPDTIGSHEAVRLMPDQRLLISDWRADLLFGEPEVLVSARYLLDGGRYRRVEAEELTIYQLLFERHELITANGLLTESFLPNAFSLMVMSDPARLALLDLRPKLRRAPNKAFGPEIRPTLRRWEVKYLMRD